MAFEYRAFNPTGKSHFIASDSTAPTGIQVSSDAGTGKPSPSQYRICNLHTAAVYVAWAEAATTAQTNAVIPTAGNHKNVLAIPAGGVEVVSLKADLYFSSISAAAATLGVLITPGQGL